MAHARNLANKERLALFLCAIVILGGAALVLLWWLSVLPRMD